MVDGEGPLVISREVRLRAASPAGRQGPLYITGGSWGTGLCRLPQSTYASGLWPTAVAVQRVALRPTTKVPAAMKILTYETRPGVLAERRSFGGDGLDAVRGRRPA